MLADERFAVAKPIREHDRLTVLAQHVRINARRGVDGLDEEAEVYGSFLPKNRDEARRAKGVEHGT
jgi:hypothetical protein